MSVLLIQIDENDFMKVKELITRNYAGAKVITVNQLPGDTDWLLSMTEIPDLLDRLINTAGEPAVQRVLHYINCHFRRSLTLEEVSSEVHLNPVYFSQWFKQKTDCGFKEYITYIRLQEVRHWLLNSDHTINWIAEYVGYQDTAHLSKLFRKHFGLAPGMYRQKIRNERQASR
ncbi:MULTISPECIES: helix-turn-helix transcriptional regulator [Paenibacillus]|uniref:helix-turn-helix transcriptional regulator n=1 Tax=Paenibacillus TaxID=44249 RepID=UPI0004725BAF|nr:AraC family transcriptional regulator [Paenibacillus maysiensis]